MNTSIKFKKYLCGLLISAFVPVTVLAQGAKDIPEAELAPAASSASINNTFALNYQILTAKLFKEVGQESSLLERVTEPNGAVTYRAKERAPDAERYISASIVGDAIITMDALVSNPDLEEVTEISKQYYAQVLEAAMTLYEPAIEMDNARKEKDQKAYDAALDDYNKALKAYVAAYNNKNKKEYQLSDAQIKAIKEANLKRRINEYNRNKK